MPDESGSLVLLAGSERAPIPAATPAGTLDTSQRAEVTVVIRRRAELPAEIVAGPTVLTSEELADRYGADPADVALVREQLTARGLEITAVHPVTRRIKAAGTLADLASAFGTTLTQVSSPDHRGRQVTHRYREGPLYVPAALDGVVLAVLGLDTRPEFRPHYRTRGTPGPAASPGVSYTPVQVASIYDFPAGTTGAGQTVAVIELGGGFTQSDLDTYFSGLGITPTPSVTAVSVDGASNNPGDTSGANVEVSLDIDVIGAAAPGAAQLVYFAPNNGDQGFVDAISQAAQANPAPIAISISWGQSEDSWTSQGLSAMNAAMSDAAALGITDGVNDGQQHVDFPASSPYALGCGGTKLLADPATNVISSEVVWNELAAGEGATGGGVSDQFALPSWQANAGVPARATAAAASPAGGAAAASPGGAASSTAGDLAGSAAGDPAGSAAGSGHHRHHPGGSGGTGTGSGGTGSGGTGTGGTGTGGTGAGSGGRGVPDVTGNGDPTTGYQIYSGGQAQVVGGTSAVAPLWSALIARLAQATGKRFGLLQPIVYAGVTPGVAVAGYHDITSGNNGAYSARPGWDACSGLGSPDGTALLNRLNA
jgi:kumamolisin